eukprot:5064293-Alexandrium_andersonii.AAC.1
MEEAIKESVAVQAEEDAQAERPPPERATAASSADSPRAAELLNEVNEITLVLVAVYVAWERFARNSYPTLLKATVGRMRCR